MTTGPLDILLTVMLAWQSASGVENSSTSDKTAFQKRYGVELHVAGEDINVQLLSGRISASECDSQRAADYLTTAIREFRVYPVSFVKRSRLKRIVICEKLSYADQRRAAVPDFRNDTLYLDCERGRSNNDYQRTVMHHEFFHMVDYRDDGFVYEDRSWKKLNAATFSYGSGGAKVQNDQRQSFYRIPTDGFLTNYATSGVEEDKAELFAHMIVNPEHVDQMQQSDEVLDQKTGAMKALLRSFCEEMDDSFWMRVRKTTARRRKAANRKN